MPQQILTIDELLAMVQSIESKIEKLISELAKCQLTHATLALSQRHTVDSNGFDSVFDDIDSVQLTRLTGEEALHAALSLIGFHKRHSDILAQPTETLSQIGSRRAIGIIHLAPASPEHEKKVRKLVQEINDTKRTFLTEVKKTFPTDLQRTRLFYRKYLTEIVPISITRLIQLAPINTVRVHFSWLQAGYKQKPFSRSEVKDWITSINRKKIKQNPNLTIDLEQLVAMDMNRLSGYDKLYRITPTKINPRHKIVYLHDGKKVRTNPARSSMPLLVVQDKPLEAYSELKEFDALSELAEVHGKKTVEHIPAIEEYALYVRKEPDR